MTSKSFFYLPVLLLLSFFLFATNARAQQQFDEQEVILSFRFGNAVNTYVTAIYREDQFFLPHTELFRLLQLDMTVNIAASAVSGRYVNGQPYRINYASAIARIGETEVLLTADDYMVRELDYYLAPDLFLELFGMDFRINFNTLSLTLETDFEMPVVTQLARERQRERTLRNAQQIDRSFYPLRYDRDKHLINAGFLDYNLTANISGSSSNYLLNSAVGMELAGGDLQGTIFGNWSSTNKTFRTQNLRWQYGIRDTPWISRITVGQTASRGLRPSAITGIQVTNSPLEPRYIFDDYVLSGSTIPQAEVELLRNNSLISYQQADDSGNYRFVVPLTYGTTRYNLRVYSPDGTVTENPTRIQVPFEFNPPGELNYNLSAGQLNSPIPGTPRRGYMGRGGATLGLTNWLSFNSGVEYYENFHTDMPTLSAGLSSRLFRNYLVTVRAASQAFYSVNAGVYYGNGANINLDFVRYNYQGGLYNSGRNNSLFRGSIFTPFTIASLPVFFRGSVSREIQSVSAITRYRLELNSIIGKTNLRLGYRDSQAGTPEFTATPASRLTASARISIPRTTSTPALFRGMFIRGQTSYAPSINELIDAEIQTNRRFLGDGRIQLAYGQNFIGNYNYFRVNINLDFNSVRSNTSVRSSRGNVNMTQSVRGSIGIDSKNRRLTVSNRQQTGMAGVAVRMFVDENNSGEYDEGEELITQPAVRVERAGGIVQNRGGITYISQLQPYRQYNLTVNKTAILNPLLVPEVEQFSFVSDPNQYKSIDIPLYYSGVIEGRVLRRTGDVDSPLSGVRLTIIQTDHDEGSEPYTTNLSTFSDGTFYAWEIPPGNYDIQIDPVQLQFLQARAVPEVLNIDVQALAEGDFVTGLQILVVPSESGSSPENNNSDPVEP